MNDSIISILITSLNGEASILKSYGVLYSPSVINRELSKMTRAYNHGRARGVSLRRPSPQMGRDKLSLYRAKAISRIVKRAKAQT